MDDLIRRSDVVELLYGDRITGQSLKIICELGNGLQVETLNQACERHVRLVRDIPAVDAVEVVRCRECIHRKKHQTDEQQGDTICTLDWSARKLDWYCAYGERREDGDA